MAYTAVGSNETPTYRVLDAQSVSGGGAIATTDAIPCDGFTGCHVPVTTDCTQWHRIVQSSADGASWHDLDATYNLNGSSAKVATIGGARFVRLLIQNLSGSTATFTVHVGLA